MQDLIKLIFILSAFFIIGWFVSFQYDPYRVCVDHPEVGMRRDYYLCEPGGFTLEKGTRLERTAEERFPWEKHGDVIIGTNRPKNKTLSKLEQSQNDLKAFKCKAEFYSLSDTQLMKLSKEELDSLCTPTGATGNSPIPRNIQPINIDELDLDYNKDL